MSKPGDEKTGFPGTYFERDAALRWAGWARILGWLIFCVYLLQYSVETGLHLFNAWLGGYSPDWFYLLLRLNAPFQGALILAALRLLSFALLILLDIEDNTRRAARK